MMPMPGLEISCITGVHALSISPDKYYDNTIIGEMEGIQRIGSRSGDSSLGQVPKYVVIDEIPGTI
jgi:hypothetical protein